MLESLDNGREEKDKRVKNHKEKIRGNVIRFNTGSCLKKRESCHPEDMCPKNDASSEGIDLKLEKNHLKMITNESGVYHNVRELEDERSKCSDDECCRESRQTARMTGSSCRALKCAVSTLHRLDDFNMEKIGSGFFSEVFKVTHKMTGKVMVLKMNLLRSNRPNMLKEVQLMNQLKHRNILNFLGVCVHEGQLHALTEYINGGSLEQLIQSWNIELPYLTRQQLALDIACGMEYLHGKGVFHRDLTSKNVLIKRSDNGSMMAVVGDFGLAAKIPDPKCKYRLPTVGSAYWMSPECLKGQWYNEKSDVFSYGIVLCELIARIEADPDVLPRTDNFGLDYLAFSELCGPCPPHFLKLAFSCSTFEPKSRPGFSEIVKTLERLIPEYEKLLKKGSEEQENFVNSGSLGSLMDVTDKPSITARSEEVINKCPVVTKDTMHHRKLHHRRSLSEDVANFVFPKHTAPSDKARCHFLTAPKHLNYEILANPKHIGERMCQEDPHYKPRLSGEKGSRSNPFLALSQFREVKKIVGSQNVHHSKDRQKSAESPNSFFYNNDLFSSCFELPSPFYGITPPSSPAAGTSFEEKPKDGNCREIFQIGCDLTSENSEKRPTDRSVLNSKTRNSSRSPSVCASDSVKTKQNLNLSSSPKSVTSFRRLETTSFNDDRSEINCAGTAAHLVRAADTKIFPNGPHFSYELPCGNESASTSYCSVLSASLPSSPTLRKKSIPKETEFAQKEMEKQFGNHPSVIESNEMPKRLTKSKTVPLLKNTQISVLENTDPEKYERKKIYVKEPNGSSHSSENFHLKRVFQFNLPHAREMAKSDKSKHTKEASFNSLGGSRMSSSSSNLLECRIDDTFLVASSSQLRRRGSCESGFFSCMGEDYAAGNEILPSCEYELHSSRQKHLDNSLATLSSSSAASSLFLLDDSLSTTTVSSLKSGSGDFNELDDLSTKFSQHSSILFSGKRSSSVYTDSSEDISSLVDMDERNQTRYQSQQISRIVEYFERKQTSGLSSRNESLSKLRKNYNIEFQKNLERFDSLRSSNGDKIKWEGLEGKFRKSGMGLVQRRENCDENIRSKIIYDLGSNKIRKFGPQNVSEISHHQEFPKKFDGGSISDAIRKSKIELLRKSLEKGTLQVPGIHPHLDGGGVTGASPRVLATRLMICEGAVKSKLPLFDKK